MVVLLEATGGSAGGSRWLAVLFFFSLSPLFFILFSASFFFFFRPSPSLFSSFSSLLCPLFSVPPHLSRALPCIYRKNRGDRGRGRPLCSHPKNCPRNTPPPSSPTRGKLRATGVGKVGVFFKREMVVTEEEKSSSSPASRVQGKKRTHNAFKLAPFWVFPFFLMNSV